MNRIFCTILFAAFIFAAVLPGISRAADAIVTGPGERTELWTGRVLTAKFRAGMCFEDNGKARGVLILRHANGNEDAYHLYGHIRNDTFELSHSSGHHFAGRLVSPDEMEGSVKISKGPKLSLSGKRVLNAPLAASDCAPLY